MGNIRGISFKAIRRYVKETYGEEGLNKVLVNLPDEDKKVMSGKFDPMKWYPGKAIVRFMAVADKICGKGDYQLCYMTGRAAAEYAFGGIYKMFLELGKPQTVIRRGPLAWRLIDSTGDLELETLDNNSVKAKLVGFEDHHKAHCWHLVGYFQRVIELSGAKNVHVKELKCRSEGADYCEFEARWE